MRLYCRCGLPPSLCLCAELPTLEVRMGVVLMMHRREPAKSSNTARLVMAMIPAAKRVVVGARDRVSAVAKLPAGRRLLLFPLQGAEELHPPDQIMPIGGSAHLADDVHGLGHHVPLARTDDRQLPIAEFDLLVDDPLV